MHSVLKKDHISCGRNGSEGLLQYHASMDNRKYNTLTVESERMFMSGCTGEMGKLIMAVLASLYTVQKQKE